MVSNPNQLALHGSLASGACSGTLLCMTRRLIDASAAGDVLWELQLVVIAAVLNL